MDPTMLCTIETAKQTAATAFKTGKKLAVDLAGKTHDHLEKRYGNLPELCRTPGTDFAKIETVPLRIRQKINLCDEIANEIGTPEIKASINEILEQVSSPLYTVLMIGRYNTGKSSIINALLGRDILPSGTIPTTKVLTWLLAGDEDAVICEKQSGELVKLPLSALSDISPENQINQSRNIIVTINSELLNSGVALIDTPGLQDTDQSAIDITHRSIEGADALLYVIDTYLSAKEEKFLSDLSKAGKTENLFVIINKMDSVPDDERDDFIEERIDVLNKLGIAANIFPVSARDKSMSPQLDKLKKALISFMANDMEKSRSSIVEGKVNALMDVVHNACQSAKSAQELSADKHSEIQIKLQKNLDAFKDKKNQAIRKAEKKVGEVENTIMFNWESFYSSLKGEINVKIDNATVDDMKRRDFIESIVIAKTFEFLNREFEEAAATLDSWIDEEGEIMLSPEIYDSFALGTAQSTGISKIPPQLMTAGLVIFQYAAFGVFSAIKMLVLTQIGGPLINGFFQSLTSWGDAAAMRRQLRKVLDEHWPLFDEQIKAKIREYCNSFRSQIINKIERDSAMSMEGGCAVLNVLERSVQNQSLDPEKLNKWLNSTERR